MQKENNSFLEEEVRELEDALMYVLIEETKGAVSLEHAMLMLVQKGLVKTEAIRNKAIKEEFKLYIKNPLNKRLVIYANLAAKYDLSEDHIRKILSK